MTATYPSVDGLVVEHDGGILRLRLDRPQRRNAVTDEIVAALIDLIETAGSDEAVRVIHLTGTGEHFCSGFDLATRGGSDERPRVGSTQRRIRVEVNRLIPTILETQVPVVTSARGWCIGLGLNLVLASDLAVVADDARLRHPFTRLGFTPDSGASWLLPRLVGVARAKELLLLGREIDGATAAAWGMVHRSVPAADLDAAAEELVEELAGAATVAVGLTKVLVNRAPTTPLDQHLADEAFALELASRSEDFQEAVRSRREKRDPDFTGR